MHREVTQVGTALICTVTNAQPESTLTPAKAHLERDLRRRVSSTRIHTPIVFGVALGRVVSDKEPNRAVTGPDEAKPPRGNLDTNETGRDIRAFGRTQPPEAPFPARFQGHHRRSLAAQE